MPTIKNMLQIEASASKDRDLEIHALAPMLYANPGNYARGAVRKARKVGSAGMARAGQIGKAGLTRASTLGKRAGQIGKAGFTRANQQIGSKLARVGTKQMSFPFATSTVGKELGRLGTQVGRGAARVGTKVGTGVVNVARSGAGLAKTGAGLAKAGVMNRQITGIPMSTLVKSPAARKLAGQTIRKGLSRFARIGLPAAAIGIGTGLAYQAYKRSKARQAQQYQQSSPQRYGGY